jgi:protein arginine kinase
MLNLPPWYGTEGDAGDVVLASRVRLSRNLADRPFPLRLSAEDARTIRAMLVEHLQKTRSGLVMHAVPDDNQDPFRGLLAEQCRVGANSPTIESALLVEETGASLAAINVVDHLRLVADEGGLALKQAWDRVAVLEKDLESDLHFSASLDWGYLSSEIRRSGTGLKASLLLHLPGISMGMDVAEVMKTVMRAGYLLSPLFAGADKDAVSSQADLYLLTHAVSIGMSEHEILEKLEEIAVNLVNYEREVRATILEKKFVPLEDSIRRSWAILGHSKSLPFSETLRLLSLVRLGIAGGILEEPDLGTITRLFFLTQPCQVRFASERLEMTDNVDMINKERAAVVRSVLDRTTERGGGDV